MSSKRSTSYFPAPSYKRRVMSLEYKLITLDYKLWKVIKDFYSKMKICELGKTFVSPASILI